MQAGVAQLAEHQPSKLRVAGSKPVSRSRKIKGLDKYLALFFLAYLPLVAISFTSPLKTLEKLPDLRILAQIFTPDWRPSFSKIENLALPPAAGSSMDQVIAEPFGSGSFITPL